MQLGGIAAIVTGGASGLGASTARMLAGRGAQVAVFDLNEQAARDLIQDIGGVFCKVNVSDEGSVVEGLSEAEQRHGVARVLVNCAGVPAAVKTVTKHNAYHPLDTFRRVIETNLIGTFNVISKFAARLSAWETQEEERGVVINTASVAAYDGQIGQAAYAASKAGVVGLTLPVARDLSQHRIRVVTLAPGLFLTPMMMGIPPERRDSLGTQVPHPNRLGRPSDHNKDRVLINLHGGGMLVGARYGGQLESIPISSIGRIRVVTVDYRMIPHKYPAAEDDVISVYRALLKKYRPENIGIYGCSSGASLTGRTVAILIASGQSKPGAIGMFGEGPFGRKADGDSNYIFSGGQPVLRPDSYTAALDMENRASYPVEAPDIQRQFPPSLLISCTRDLGLSRTVFAHSVLVDLGVDAELHVWEGVQHCSFAQPFVDPDVPETQQAWQTIIKFFDSHLGRSGR